MFYMKLEASTFGLFVLSLWLSEHSSQKERRAEQAQIARGKRQGCCGSMFCLQVSPTKAGARV